MLGIVRGGVAVAAPVAAALQGDLAPAFATKIGAPGNPELAIGAISDGERFIDEAAVGRLGVSAERLQDEIERRSELLADKRARFSQFERDVAGRSVVVTDDGVATGHTMAAVLMSVRAAEPASTTLAVPVGPPASLGRLSALVDAVVCPRQPRSFRAVGLWYESFPQLSDDDVEALLQEWARRPPPSSGRLS